ncbi:MAG TPA: hypothetical protein VF721_16800 [Pyrinomonadaceae bacterium]|jgi:hypothetical protein
MKKSVFALVFVFCLLGITYGGEKNPQNSSLMFNERESLMKESILQMENYSFWMTTDSLGFIEAMAESCSISDKHGSCSVTCSKGKAICRPGHWKLRDSNGFTGVRLYESVPPTCFCSGS